MLEEILSSSYFGKFFNDKLPHNQFHCRESWSGHILRSWPLSKILPIPHFCFDSTAQKKNKELMEIFYFSINFKDLLNTYYEYYLKVLLPKNKPVSWILEAPSIIEESSFSPYFAKFFKVKCLQNQFHCKRSVSGHFPLSWIDIF